MPRRLARLILIIATLLSLAQFPPALAQDNFRDVIEMSVEVGFDSFFRPEQWTPLRVELKNNGESVIGRLVVRPETSGTVVGNAFSAPLDLPTGAAKSTLLNIQARSFPDQIRVELIDEDGVVRASREAGLTDLGAQNQLYAVVAGANTAAPNLTGIHIGGFKAEQAIWRAHEIPEQGLSLGSLDLMMLINIDGESLSSGQRRAIEDWVEGGGHLIVTGGPSALSLAALSDILPLTPTGSQSLDDLNALAIFAGDKWPLSQRAVVAVGQAHDDAETLVAQDGIPLLLRREIGAGLVDFLAADPTLEPLASWARVDELWRQAAGDAGAASDLARRLHPARMGRRRHRQFAGGGSAAADANALPLPRLVYRLDRSPELFRADAVAAQRLCLVHDPGRHHFLHRHRLDGRLQFARRGDHRQPPDAGAILCRS